MPKANDRALCEVFWKALVSGVPPYLDLGPDDWCSKAFEEMLQTAGSAFWNQYQPQNVQAMETLVGWVLPQNELLESEGRDHSSRSIGGALSKTAVLSANRGTGS
jgi:hypothetical protein